MTWARRCSAVLAVVLLCFACADHTPPQPERCAPAGSGTPVDAVMLSFLSRARAAHHIADNHEQNQRWDDAIKTLNGLLKGPLPPKHPEVREVLADTHARLADLKSQQGQFDGAGANVESGLKLATSETYFRGHLFEMRGLVEERRAKQLKADGDDAGAKAATERALAAFEESMRIQAKVIESALPPPAPSASGEAKP